MADPQVIPEASPEGGAPPEPHPACTLCNDVAPCRWHRSREPQEMITTLLRAIKREGVAGYASWVESACANLDPGVVLPAEVCTGLVRLPREPLAVELGELAEGLLSEGLDTNELTRMAALCLTLAGVTGLENG